MFSQISTGVVPFNQASDWQDRCLTRQHISFPRLAVFTLLFLTVIGGRIFLALLEGRPYGIQLTSMVLYTAAVVDAIDSRPCQSEYKNRRQQSQPGKPYAEVIEHVD